MKPEQVWKAVCGELQLQMTKSSFNTWLRDAHFLNYIDNTYRIGVPNAYVKDWLENRLHTTIRRTLDAVVGQPVEIQFTIWKQGQDQPLQPIQLDSDFAPTPLNPPSRLHPNQLVATPLPLPKPSATQSGASNLNPLHRFENFVVGNSNQMAAAAAQAVADNPGRAYNPFFIYGGVGLGKTHLLHAIGNECATRGLQVLYVPAEAFANDLISAIRTRSTPDFRDKYRTVDVLLVDDIQFIAGKESTQDEFFHTFNALHTQRKQIVLTCDRPPHELKTLEDRLRSRFEWGLIVDVQPPDVETRIAILESKLQTHRRVIPRNVLTFIAERVQNNVRELEGALNRVLAHGDILHRPFDPETASDALGQSLPSQAGSATAPARPATSAKSGAETLLQVVTPKLSVTLERIVEVVARQFAVSAQDLRSTSRKKQFSLPRQLSMFVMREELQASLPQIGEALGGRDHSTVLHGCEKIQYLMETDANMRQSLLAVKRELYE
jgi:chromosomal replication initiator protein